MSIKFSISSQEFSPDNPFSYSLYCISSFRDFTPPPLFIKNWQQNQERGMQKCVVCIKALAEPYTLFSGVGMWYAIFVRCCCFEI